MVRTAPALVRIGLPRSDLVKKKQLPTYANSYVIIKAHHAMGRGSSMLLTTSGDVIDRREMHMMRDVSPYKP